MRSDEIVHSVWQFSLRRAARKIFNVLVAFCAGIFIVRLFNNASDEQPERRRAAVEH
jgi:hypothetical protein